MEVKLQKVNGKRVIGTSDLVYCNVKWNKPYLAVIGKDGEMIWQPKENLGYGKHQETFYNVEALKPGDLIKAAGGSGSNKYPFHGRVVELTETTLTVEEISERDMSNIMAELQASPVKEKLTIELSGEALATFKRLQADPVNILTGEEIIAAALNLFEMSRKAN